MNLKSLLLLPAAALLWAPKPAEAYVGFRIGVGIPLVYPWPGYYAGPVTYTQTVYAAPPQAVGEQISPAPGPGYVWIAAHWSNVAQRWVWVPGHWELPPSPSATWTGGHWVQGTGGWVWVDGAWTVGGTPAQPAGLPPVPVPPSTSPDAAPPAPPGGQPAPAGTMPPPPPPGAPAAVPQPSTPAPAVTDMAEGTVVIEPPPAPISEFVPVAPYPDYVWIGGYWGWHGGWYWTAGHYAPRPYHGALWVSGSWGRGPHGWAWHSGHWH